MPKTPNALVATSLTLVAINVGLVVQNRVLKGRVEAAELEALETFEADAGSSVPSLSGIDFSTGELVEYRYGEDGRPTLILSFSPFCGICEENWPTWRAIVDEYPLERLRIVAVDLTQKAEWTYLLSHGLGQEVPVITELDPRSVQDYRLRFTPQSLLVRPDGVVDKVWTGRLRPADVEDLEDRIRRLEGTWAPAGASDA